MTKNSVSLTKALRALGDPVRLQLVRLILRERSVLDRRCSSRTGVCFCHLCEAVDLAPATVSHHLKILREAGLIEGLREGRWTYFRVREGALGTFLDSLAAWFDLSVSPVTEPDSDLPVSHRPTSARR